MPGSNTDRYDRYGRRRDQPVRLERRESFSRKAQEAIVQQENRERKNRESNLRTIQSWLSLCDSKHDVHCHTNSATSNDTGGRPLWLIDVQSLCLKQADPSWQYAALSYVWGNVHTVHATTRNIEHLQESRVLGKLCVARTIMHAIDLARDLKIAYLWVDCLCILQDDEKAKHSQICEMASIYANAYLTIVAASGTHADHGFKACTKTEDARSLYAGLRVSADPQVRQRQIHEFLLSESPWMGRGWTLQELVFSRRAIFLFDSTITWQCHCATWEVSMASTMLPATSCSETFSEVAQGLQFSLWPDLEEYARLVHSYSGRKLTHLHDRYRAFLGITSTFARSFQEGFLWGLPEMFFDVALLWQSESFLSKPSRRLDDYPSWSWMGWSGPICPWSWACGFSYVREITRAPRRQGNSWRATSWTCSPTIQWRCGHDGVPARMIMATGNKYKSLATPTCSESVPPGWTELQGLAGPLFKCNQSSDVLFNHPVPTRDITIPQEPVVQIPHLSCMTRRCYMQVVLWQGVSKERTPWLRDAHGFWAGWLGDNSWNDLTLRQRLSSNVFTRELIEISAGSASNSWDESDYLQEWNDAGRPKQGDLYEFYNVLWIEWKDGVAYRKALGRVLKDVWDQEATETVEVTLG